MGDRIDTPDQLIARAAEGRLSKHAMATLLVPWSRAAFLEACAAIEQQYTAACTGTGDPCLASGCSLEGGICLQPLLRAGTDYHKACAAAWLPRFADPANRAAWWTADAAEILA